jgi:hypothetical protein
MTDSIFAQRQGDGDKKLCFNYIYLYLHIYKIIYIFKLYFKHYCPILAFLVAHLFLNLENLYFKSWYINVIWYYPATQSELDPHLGMLPVRVYVKSGHLVECCTVGKDKHQHQLAHPDQMSRNFHLVRLIHWYSEVWTVWIQDTFFNSWQLCHCRRSQPSTMEESFDLN